MSELAKTGFPTAADVIALQRAMSSLPQAHLETRHYFADGMYLREVPRPAGTTIVGKVHKKEHFYIVIKGRVTITGEGYRETVDAPRIFVSKPGTKRAVYAHEDSICITVHRVSSEDLTKIEDELVEYDPEALFGPGNVPRQLESDECPSLLPRS
jgi:hypothetical protein